MGICDVDGCTKETIWMDVCEDHLREFESEMLLVERQMLNAYNLLDLNAYNLLDYKAVDEVYECSPEDNLPDLGAAKDTSQNKNVIEELRHDINFLAKSLSDTITSVTRMVRGQNNCVEILEKHTKILDDVVEILKQTHPPM